MRRDHPARVAPGRRAGAQRPHPGPARLHVHRRRRPRPASCGASPRGRSSASAARRAARSTCPPRGACPELTACPPPSRSSWPTRAPSPRSASSTCSSTARAWRSPTRRRLILLDGADLADHAPHPGGPRRRGPHGHAGRGGVGRRRRAASPTLENIKYFRPTGEPDADVRQPDTGVTSDAGRRHRRLRPDAERPARDRPQRGRDAHAGHRTRCSARLGHRPATTSASPARAAPTTSPARPSASSSTLDGVGAVAADPGEPRRDGRRLGAVRGLGEAPARRGRHRARLRLRQVVARATCARC